MQKVSPEIKEEIIRIKDYIPKWTDNVMNEDKDFCKFIIQTVRMNMIFRQYESDCKWLSETSDGKRISEILTRYGGKVSESPDPKTYKKLLKKWMDWRDLVETTKKKLGTK